MKRGELWWTNFDAVGASAGREQAGRRPALVISVDSLNSSGAELVIAIPLTRTDRGVRTHVPAGTATSSFIMCEQLRALSKLRFTKRLGSVSPTTLLRVEDVLRLLLAL